MERVNHFLALLAFALPFAFAFAFGIGNSLPTSSFSALRFRRAARRAGLGTMEMSKTSKPSVKVWDMKIKGFKKYHQSCSGTCAGLGLQRVWLCFPSELEQEEDSLGPGKVIHWAVCKCKVRIWSQGARLLHTPIVLQCSPAALGQHHSTYGVVDPLDVFLMYNCGPRFPMSLRSISLVLTYN